MLCRLKLFLFCVVQRYQRLSVNKDLHTVNIELRRREAIL